MSEESSQKILIEGSVLKGKRRNKKMTPWKNRWLVLFGSGTLQYYTTARSKGGKSKGVIELSNCLSIKDANSEKDHCVQMDMKEPKDVSFFFSFESDWLKKSWTSLMENFIQGASVKTAPQTYDPEASKRKSLMKQIHNSWNFTSAVKSGHILVSFQLPPKGSSGKLSWAIRFVVLSRSCLYCYKQKPTGDCQPEEEIKLDSSCRIEEDASLDKEFASRISLDGGISIALAFDSKTIKDSWLQSIAASSAQVPVSQGSVHGIQSVYTMRALEDHVPSGKPEELTYQKEDIITVTEFDESGWYEGKIDDRTGIFNSSKAERFGQVVHIRVVKTHIPEGPNELQIAEGDVLEIVAISESGWLKGHLLADMNMGWFPAGNAEVIEDAQ